MGQSNPKDDSISNIETFNHECSYCAITFWDIVRTPPWLFVAICGFVCNLTVTSNRVGRERMGRQVRAPGHSQDAMAMKLHVVRKPRAARLACRRRPFMASANALERLSVMLRTTASRCVFSIAASFLNGSRRQRRSQLMQPSNPLSACAATLLVHALA